MHRRRLGTDEITAIVVPIVCFPADRLWKAGGEEVRVKDSRRRGSAFVPLLVWPAKQTKSTSCPLQKESREQSDDTGKADAPCKASSSGVQ